MASRLSLLIILPILSLLSLSADARPGLHFHPCKTLIVSTYSFSLLPQNPNPNLRQPDLIAVVAEVRPEFLLHHHRFFLRRPRFAAVERPEVFQRPQFPAAIQEEFSSFRDRTKDILSVVASLLFGAACGALTAGTMYLIWSLFTHTNDSYRSANGFYTDDSDDNDDEEEDIFNPKKKGYVAIPAAPTTPEADPAAPAKESA